MEKHKVVVFSDATGSIDGHYKVEKRKGCEGGKNQLVKVFFLTRFIVRLMLVKKTEINYRMRPDGGTFKNDEKGDLFGLGECFNSEFISVENELIKVR